MISNFIIMRTVKLHLKKRTNQFRCISSYYSSLSQITKSARNNFPPIIKEGLALNKELIPLTEITQIDEGLRTRIENYLVATEEAVYAVGIELEDDTSEMIAVLEDLKNMRLLILLYIDGILEDSRFS